MAYLIETSRFDDVYQFEATDPLLGHYDGIPGELNWAPQALVNRTAYLKGRVDLTDAHLIQLQLATAAALRSVDPSIGIHVAQTVGALSADDRGGGMWHWDDASTAADNLGTVLCPAGHTGAGRWRRVHEAGTYSVAWWGASGNASQDATAAIQATIDAAASDNASVVLPGGNYRITAPLAIQGGGAFSIRGVPRTPAGLVSQFLVSEIDGYLFEIHSTGRHRDFEFRHILVTGDNSTTWGGFIRNASWTYLSSLNIFDCLISGSLKQNSAALDLVYCYFINIRNSVIQDFKHGWGIKAYFCTTFLVEKSYIIRVQEGFQVQNGEYVFRDSAFEDLAAIGWISRSVVRMDGCHFERWGTVHSGNDAGGLSGLTSSITTGTGGLFNVTASDGKVSAVTIAAAGIGYEYLQTLHLVGPSGHDAYIIVNNIGPNGEITEIYLWHGGSGTSEYVTGTVSAIAKKTNSAFTLSRLSSLDIIGGCIAKESPDQPLDSFIRMDRYTGPQHINIHSPHHVITDNALHMERWFIDTYYDQASYWDGSPSPIKFNAVSLPRNLFSQVFSASDIRMINDGRMVVKSSIYGLPQCIVQIDRGRLIVENSGLAQHIHYPLGYLPYRRKDIVLTPRADRRDIVIRHIETLATENVNLAGQASATITVANSAGAVVGDAVYTWHYQPESLVLQYGLLGYVTSVPFSTQIVIASLPTQSVFPSNARVFAGDTVSVYKFQQTVGDINGPFVGAGSPDGVITAPVGTLYSRTDGGSGTVLYVKESGSGNTGWVAK